MAKTKTRTKQPAGLADEIRHRRGCPEERLEEYSARRPVDGVDVMVARCIDCGEAAVGEGDA